MDDFRRKMFTELADTSKDIREYSERIVATHGEENLIEALVIYETYRNTSGTQSLANREPIITIRFLSWLVPAWNPFPVSATTAILIGQIFLLIFSVLLPPFHFELPGGAVSNAGYHFIFSPPVTQHVTLNPTQVYQITGRVDINLLMIEWAAIFIIGIATRKAFTLKRMP